MLKLPKLVMDQPDWLIDVEMNSACHIIHLDQLPQLKMADRSFEFDHK